MEKKIGIIGAGNIGQVLAKHFSNAGYVTLINNSKGSESLSELSTKLGKLVKAASVREVAEQSQVIILSVPWSKIKQAVASLPDLTDKIVIDTTNNILSTDPWLLDDIGEKSTGEIIAGLLPGAKIVKAFNTLYFKVLEQSPAEVNGNRVIALSGDDKEAKNSVSTILKDIGFEPLDLGSLALGGKLQDIGGPLSSINLLKANDAAQEAIAVVKRNNEEVQGNSDFELFDKLFADDFVDHTTQPGMGSAGKDSVKQLYKELRNAFPDFTPEIHWQTSNGEKVTTFKTYHGTHERPIFGIPASGKKVQFQAVDVMSVKSGKITDHWGVANLFSLLNQSNAS